ncbi:CD44 antigen isoform X9 [Neophocaena asiaeorientalis asiaeorientalis]|uniref:CD44 antigen n=1 Tax=Neophocaena asiaeorientalis asiaeorientalis TaxID=1706337 RepID=A0A341C320_NEOAA|nr:CD44 antigen isoform X9 [Neophocaena asiaeorientalis asiaeorientalis]
MDTFWWRAAWGLCLVQLSLAQIDLNITCRYKGVFHVEKNGRYSISKTEAADLCKAFNCTLPTMAQMEAALRAGFETCRYGFIDGHVVIPRIHPNSICAANNTGVYILTSNTSQYDTYCFNASAPPEEDCTSVTDLPNAFEGPITITIVNRDGTRYTKKGEYRTNPDDINPSTTPEEDMSSGSSSERSTSGGYNIFHTHLPTVYPTPDQDSPWVPSNPETTPATTLMSTSGTTSKTATKRQEAQDWFSWWFQPSATKIHLHTTTIMAAQPLMQVTTTGTDSNIISAGWEATEENEDESDRHPSYSGSDTDDDEDFISSTNVDTSHSTTLQPSAGPNTGLVEDLDRTGPLSVTTQQSDTQSFSTSRGGLEEDKDHPMTASPTSSNRNDGTGGRRGENLPEDSTTSVEGYTPYSPDTNEYRTLIPVTPAKAGSPEVTVVGDSTSNVDLSLSEDQDSSHDPSGRSYTTHGSESAGHSSGSQERGANTTSGPMRKPQIPEWLIILASLLALALILAVCIAVNSRRRCGQKKKLVINSGNGTMEERKPSGLNGEASKSQEMVHLVNKESSETPDQFMTADERQNLQNVDMKIGV